MTDDEDGKTGDAISDAIAALRYPGNPDDFDQRYAKAEVQADALWNAQNLTVIGGGVIDEDDALLATNQVLQLIHEFS